AVVAHLHRAVGVQHHVDAGAEPAEGLVDGVVDDLPHAVGEAAAVGRPDVHPGTLADRLEPFQDREMPRGVVLGLVNGCGKGGHLDVSCIRRTGRAAKPLGCVRGAPAYAFAARAGWCGAAAPRGTGSRGPAQPNRAWGHPLWRTAAFPLRPLRRVATRLRSDAGPAFLRGSGRRPNPS